MFMRRDMIVTLLIMGPIYPLVFRRIGCVRSPPPVPVAVVVHHVPLVPVYVSRSSSLRQSLNNLHSSLAETTCNGSVGGPIPRPSPFSKTLSWHHTFFKPRTSHVLLKNGVKDSYHQHFPVNSSSRFMNTTSTTFKESTMSMPMDLQRVVSVLEEFAPTSLAGSWDNVGLLVEPTSPHQVSTMFLTNDLTEEGLMEAIGQKADFILAYHPPIFVPLKRLTMRSAKERIIIRAIENRIAIYSPHTSYDAVEGGVNDWLVEGLGDVQQNVPLTASTEATTPSGDDVGITFTSTEDLAESHREVLAQANFVSSILTSDGNFQISCTCQKSNLGRIMSSVRGMSCINHQSVQITELVKAPIVKTGVGRIATLSEPTQISAVVQRIKTHLKLDHVQIAIGQGKSLDSLISSVAICAGSGASVLKNVKADLYLTGEMSHHEILAAVAMGTTVVTCNHSNTERGYLYVLKEKLIEKFESRMNIFVSETDKDPLQFF